MATKLKGKTPAEVQPGHSKILISGPPGSGKSWFATSFPNPYYIDTEGGAERKHYAARIRKAGGAYLGPEDGACDFETIISEIKTLSTEKHEYRTLIIDSITKVFQATVARKSEELGDKDAFGASKKPAIAAMRRILGWLPKLRMNVVFIAHEVAKWEGEGRDRKQVGMIPDVWEKVPYELDLTLRVQSHSRGLRTATVEKSRLLGFPEFERFELQNASGDCGYENFATRYGKDYIEAPSQPVILATPEQVAEIERILSFVKVDADEIEKKLAKYQAESWAELTKDQAALAVKWLESLIPAKAGA